MDWGPSSERTSQLWLAALLYRVTGGEARHCLPDQSAGTAKAGKQTKDIPDQGAIHPGSKILSSERHCHFPLQALAILCQSLKPEAGLRIGKDVFVAILKRTDQMRSKAGPG